MKLTERLYRPTKLERKVAQLESQNAKLLQAVNDKDQELFESQELVGELLDALEDTLTIHKNADSIPYGKVTEIAEFNVPACLCKLCIRTRVAIRKAKGD